MTNAIIIALCAMLALALAFGIVLLGRYRALERRYETFLATTPGWESRFHDAIYL
jgi:hypothetical protein